VLATLSSPFFFEIKDGEAIYNKKALVSEIRVVSSYSKTRWGRG
jgi:hypothetical protein